MAALADAGVTVMRMDVTDDDSMTAGVGRILAATGRIDLLVNNAGYGSFGSVEDVPLDEARRQFDVNVFGLARLIQLVVPQMRARGSGRIINVSSIGGKIYEPLGGWYHSTKFAVEGLSDSLRIELRPFGIDVVLIEPGPIRTEWSSIARENMLKASAGTAYAQQSESVARVLEAADRPRRGTEPDVVARKIVRAATVRHPRARYPVGRGAGTIIWARTLLPDRAFDAIIARTFQG
jgi:NAD(P)-dependent dehydrogenase (short-subunit alcohol dehydrogenase family)